MEQNPLQSLREKFGTYGFTRLSASVKPVIERQVKPHVGLSVQLLPEDCEYPMKWVCHDDFLILGFGATKEEAYYDWSNRHRRRARIPREGHADLETCKLWYEQGCPAIELFANNLHVFSYDPEKDELILRG